MSTPPTWLTDLAARAQSVTPAELTRFADLPSEGRASAVLMLFGEGPRGTDVLIIERSGDMRSHAGQPAFPGGATDADDVDAIATALREAQEETGLDPIGIDILASFTAIPVPVSGFVVTPVLGWWREPSPVHAAAPAEVQRVARVALADLVDPARRVRVRHPSGYVGMAFDVEGMLVWGFTGGLLYRLLSLAGLINPADDVDAPTRDLPVA